MMAVPVFVADSPVHGFGLFAAVPIPKGTTLWRYVEGVDSRTPIGEIERPERWLHYGYINPRRPGILVFCGDLACYWNFPVVGSEPNCIEGRVGAHGEADIVAASDIACGEELLIDPASDADYCRKLGITKFQPH